MKGVNDQVLCRICNLESFRSANLLKPGFHSPEPAVKPVLAAADNLLDV
jgi:hypothetical protein